MPEQLGMGTETDEVDLVGFTVEPDQEEIALYMALHKSGIITGKQMRIVFGRNGNSRLKHAEDDH